MRAAVRRGEAVAAADQPRGPAQRRRRRRGREQPEPEGDVRQHPAAAGDLSRGHGARPLAAPHGLPPRTRLRPRHPLHRQKPGTEKCSIFQFNYRAGLKYHSQVVIFSDKFRQQQEQNSPNLATEIELTLAN